MKIVKPIQFQDAMLISTTATNAEVDWNSGTTYAIGEIRTYSNKRWESLQNANTNHPPSTSPTWWLLLGADNKHAMFDSLVSTSTVGTTSMTVVVAPGAIFDTVALINIEAALINITVRNGITGPIVYENTAGVSSSNVANWFEYYFSDPLVERTQVIFYDIPPYINAYITLEFTNSTGLPVSCAQTVTGTVFQIGGTQYGANAGIVDYSLKDTDEFGTVTFVERAFSKRLNAVVYVKNSELNRIQSLLYSVRAKPSVWIGSDDPNYQETLIVYGFYREFSTDIAYPQHSLCSLDIESLI